MENAQDRLERDVIAFARRAKDASSDLLKLDANARDRALLAMVQALSDVKQQVLRANSEDVREAQQKGLPASFIDRLMLTAERFDTMLEGVRQVASQKNVIGELSEVHRTAQGLEVARMRVPLGVIVMIFEARPNVSVDAAALAWKSGNAIILRGGSEAFRSNEVLVRALRKGLACQNLPEDAIQMVNTRDHEATRILLAQSDLIDLAIPRGGESLVRMVKNHARVPVIQHFKGVCHLYLDSGCDPAMAWSLLENGKMQRPATCNATECLLVHVDESESLLIELVRKLIRQGAEIRACERSFAVLTKAMPQELKLTRALASDFGKEFLDTVLAIRLVDNFEDALTHIRQYGSNHTETICTSNFEHAERWLREVDAGCVLVNASTRLHDGSALGLGAEVGISTSKFHAYGAMGVEQLTALKWIVRGHGQVRG